MVDRISALPDELLCHILSFLPTQNAVATTILSKRWRPLWLSLPTLDFNDKPYLTNDKPYSSFRNFVHKTLLARDAHHLSITTFRLKCSELNKQFGVSDSELNEWVNIAIKRGIEILDIEFPFTIAGRELSLRSCIFTCRTLVVLKLTQLNFGDFSSVDLPSLKTLHLNDVTFIKRHHLMDLLNGCPCLVDLKATSVYRSNYDGGYTRKGEFKTLPMLVKAYIWDIVGIDIALKAFCNLEFLRVEESSAGKYIGDIHAFPNLTEMKLVFYGDNWNFVLTMLGLCPKLQSFALEILFGSADAVWPSPSFVPECLLSQLRECVIRNYDGTESELLFARYILLNSRALRTIKIWGVFSRDKDEMFDELVSCPWSSPTCELFFTNWYAC